MLIFPVFIPQQGCPFQCIYCDQKAFSAVRETPPEVLTEQLRSFCLKHKDQAKQIAFYGGTFTALPEAEREHFYQLTEPFLDALTTLRISTRPDAVEDKELSWCREHQVKTIELGIQDFDDEVLLASGRGYSSKTAIEGCLRVQRAGFELGIQLMPGLPGFSPIINPASTWTPPGLRPRYLRVYPVVVIKGTPLWDEYLAGRYQPLELEQAISICADYCVQAELRDCEVIKIGIPPLQKGVEYAGPYHPALGELVWGELLIRKIATVYDTQNTIFIASEDISLLTGHQGYNKSKMMKRIDRSSLNIKIDSSLKKGEFRLANEPTDNNLITKSEAT